MPAAATIGETGIVNMPIVSVPRDEHAYYRLLPMFLAVASRGETGGSELLSADWPCEGHLEP
jgi:hypothetical protein